MAAWGRPRAPGRACWSGSATRDAEAWAQFVEVYAPLVYGFARSAAAGRRRGRPDPGGAPGRAGARRPARLRPAARLVPRLAVHGGPQPAAQAPATGGGAQRPACGGEDARAGPGGPAGRRRGGGARGTGSTSGGCSPGPPSRCAATSSEATWQAFWRTAVDGRSAGEVAAELLGLSVGGRLHSPGAACWPGSRSAVQALQEGDATAPEGGAAMVRATPARTGPAAERCSTALLSARRQDGRLSAHLDALPGCQRTLEQVRRRRRRCCVAGGRRRPGPDTAPPTPRPRRPRGAA